MEANILEFLKELKANNNREWFHANKQLYDRAKQNFETFLNELIPGISIR